MRTITFAALLAGLQARDPNQSVAAVAAARLNAASDYLWNSGTPFPDSVTGATITLSSTNKVAWTDMQQGNWFRFFDTDPRVPNASFNRIQILQADYDGVWVDLAGLNITTVFALYRKSAPRYTSTAAATSTAYAVDDVVYDTGRSGSTGNCYRSLTAYTSSSDNSTFNTELADTSKWEVQPVLLSMAEALKMGARAESKYDLSENGDGDALYAVAENKLEKQKDLLLSMFPWLNEA